ncbi:MAG: tetratricopeptide repeat protein [Methanomassiliicoccales archaeon]|nr:tetratricopeptide repeat protein [Methanomassiliicoccales archaeon]
MGSSGNPNFIEVRHGKMLISVPKEFKAKLAARYPWLTKNAIEVVMQEAQETMESVLDMERGPVEKARARFQKGRHAEALALLEQHLAQHPRDRDAWYLKGEIYFKMNKDKEGYAAFAKARV